MATNFPTSLQDLDATRGNDTDKLNSPSHTVHHTLEDDTLEALEAKIGIDSSLVATSHDYLLRHLPAQESDLAMGTHKITGVVDPTSDQHASTKKYVDDEITGLSSSYAPLASPTFTGTVTLPRTNINEYVNITETVAGALKTQVRHINSSNTVGTGGRLSFRMLDSNSAIQTYGRISTEIDTNTAGSEDGTMRLSVIGGGAYDDLLILDGSSKLATFAGGITATKTVTLPAGTTSVAPLKMVAGTNLTTEEAGALEFTGTDLFITI